MRRHRGRGVMATSTQGAVLKHLETHLGTVAVGWTRNADGVPMPFDVLRFDRAPSPRTVSFVTVGLSDHPLRSPRSGREIRHEFIMTCRDTQKDINIPALLQQVGAETSRKGRAPLRGDVIGPRGPLFVGRQMTALYVAIPIYFPDSMHSMVSAGGAETIFIWLVPVYDSEATLIATKGWETFERQLAALDPDVTDLDRPAIA